MGKKYNNYTLFIDGNSRHQHNIINMYIEHVTNDIIADDQIVHQILEMVVTNTYACYIKNPSLSERELKSMNTYERIKQEIVSEPLYEKIHEILVKGIVVSHEVLKLSNLECIENCIKYLSRVYEIKDSVTYNNTMRSLHTIGMKIKLDTLYECNFSKIFENPHYNKLLSALTSVKIACHTYITLTNSKILMDYIFNLGYVILLGDSSVTNMDIVQNKNGDLVKILEGNKHYNSLYDVLIYSHTSKTRCTPHFLREILETTINMCAELYGRTVVDKGSCLQISNPISTPNPTPTLIIHENITTLNQEINLLEKSNEKCIQEINIVKQEIKKRTVSSTVSSTVLSTDQTPNAKRKCSKMLQFISDSVSVEQMDGLIDILIK